MQEKINQFGYDDINNCLKSGCNLLYKNENTKKIGGALYQVLFAIRKIQPGALRKSRKQTISKELIGKEYRARIQKEILQSIKAILDKIIYPRKHIIYEEFKKLFGNRMEYSDGMKEKGKENYIRKQEGLRDIINEVNQGKISPEQYILGDREQDHIFLSMKSQKEQYEIIEDILYFIKDNKKSFLTLPTERAKELIENIDEFIKIIQEEKDNAFSLGKREAIKTKLTHQ